MRGQWLGAYEGDNIGKVLLNIDEYDDRFEGLAYLSPTEKTYPTSGVEFSVIGKDLDNKISASVYPIDPQNSSILNWEDIRDHFPPDFKHSKSAELNINIDDQFLRVTAETDIGLRISSKLKRFSVNEVSKLNGVIQDWIQFKNYVASIANENFLFRGQQKDWPLCSSFHRRGRFRMREFILRDVPQLHQRLSSITDHYFDRNVPDQNGAFFNLLQHHGYPTPLLDWSYSPYVAAFFAFRNIKKGNSSNESVRIYIFDHLKWKKFYPQIQFLDTPYPHLSVMDFIAINNPRLVPQQSVTTVTNIYDIESYIFDCESNSSQTFLMAVDIPANQRDIAMKDLEFMGITAGSLFPSLEGVCEAMRERNFDR